MVESMSNFDISVIIPIYNTEEFLEETIVSVLTQSIGVERIQIILVDDGSSDNSALICKAFQQEFPDNIVFIHQDNAGVSAARNKGLDVATGRSVASFLYLMVTNQPILLIIDMRQMEKKPSSHSARLHVTYTVL